MPSSPIFRAHQLSKRLQAPQSHQYKCLLELYKSLQQGNKTHRIYGTSKLSSGFAKAQCLVSRHIRIFACFLTKPRPNRGANS